MERAFLFGVEYSVVGKRYGIGLVLHLSNKLLLMDAKPKRTESASFARPEAGANNQNSDCGEKLNSGYFSPEFFLNADVLDILFEGRNKEYGAYELRRTYNRRLTKAILITSSVLLLSFAGCAIIGRSQGEKVKPLNVDDVDLTRVEQKHEEVVPPKPVMPKVPEVRQIAFTPPKLVENPPEDQKPPVQDDLDKVRIATVNTAGGDDDNTVRPDAPVGEGHGNVIEAPKKESDDAVFLPVEFESQFPGGMQAWFRFLNKNLRYPEDAQAKEISGKVIVQFIVDNNGNVSDVEAISGPTEGGLREEAVRVIKKSGKWTPGNQNGKPVKSYKRQPVTFQFSE